MNKPVLSRPSDYLDPRHRKHAGTPAEIAGKVLQNRAYYPHLGWAFFTEDFLAALKAFLEAGGTLPSVTDDQKSP